MSEDLHQVFVSKTEFDGPGIRVSGSTSGTDIYVSELAELRSSLEGSLALTEATLNTPELRELAQATRAALLGIDTLTLHLLNLHNAIYRGQINYPDDPATGYSD